MAQGSELAKVSGVVSSTLGYQRQLVQGQKQHVVSRGLQFAVNVLAKLMARMWHTMKALARRMQHAHDTQCDLTGCSELCKYQI